ncbi:hypothetical protein CesoFtcFv8_016701 [Champsocephalus esox]|uniref:Uncharacterized protein n=2 Tax=Champsocephalus TaxID=52236 RepID=A0AAN8DD61_CHAGU|nr:hypothetical protein CesoFtcFv8_016701 [Champsocephalus esox]KAK5918633.1 hypothetical protein CgunFtcFv8_003379 [Champsocephalus gunnari]
MLVNNSCPPPAEHYVMETALILDCGSEPTDRFMWAQEGRVCPVISAVKSPVGIHRPAGGTGCESVLNLLEVSQQGPRDAVENSQPGEEYCGLREE